METIARILDFWFRAEDRWFDADAAFDETIREQFAADCKRAARGALDHWATTPEGSLALIILLDQFPRNMFRGTARAFATDARALEIAEKTIERGFDRNLRADQRRFVYLPLMHAEDVDRQRRCVALFEAAGDDPKALESAIKHRQIIERFGRFPHRNGALGRPTTAEEAEFLTQAGSSF